MRRARFLLLFAVLPLCVAISPVRSTAAKPQADTAVAAQTDSTLTARVPVPEPTARALRYYRGGMVLWVLGVLLGLAVPVVVLFTGLSAKLAGWAHHLLGGISLGTKNQRQRGATVELAAAVFVAAYFSLEYLVEFPLRLYAGYLRQHAYELSNQAFVQWLRESLTAFGLEALLFMSVIPVGYFLLKLMPRRWWVAASAGAVITVVAIQVLYPVWVAPLFDEYRTMQDEALETEILELAQQAGIEGSRVFEVVKSADTKRVNASVTGFLGTKRIVLWDTIVERLKGDQLLFVMGHEMGHYVLGHRWKGLVLSSLGLVATFYLAALALPRIITGLRHRLGFENLGTVASLPLFILTFNILALIGQPIGNVVSRHWEHEADRFGLEITQDNRAAALAFVALQQTNLSNPRPGIVYKLWLASHPALAERVEFANAYRPWERGWELRYRDRFSHPHP